MKTNLSNDILVSLLEFKCMAGGGFWKACLSIKKNEKVECMKKIDVEEAVGQALAHDVTAMYDGFKGALFKRGHIIEEKDISALLDIGKKTVYVGEAEEGLLHEEDCAIRLSKMVQVPGSHYTGPSEGKVLLISDVQGMLRVDTELLKEINGIGDITIATLPDHYRLEKGAAVASMRIVPLYTEEEQIKKAEELCRDRKLIRILPYNNKRVGIIITGSEVYNGRISDKFEPVIRKKLDYYPSEIVDIKICDDDKEMIVDAARELLGKGADFLIGPVVNRASVRNMLENNIVNQPPVVLPVRIADMKPAMVMVILVNQLSVQDIREVNRLIQDDGPVVSVQVCPVQFS